MKGPGSRLRALAPRVNRGTLLAMLHPASTRIVRTALLACIGVTALTACSKEQPGSNGPSAPATSDPGGKMCTEIGCDNGARITLNKATPWVPGTYVFGFELDGKAVECKGALPLQSCESGPSLSCTPDAVVQIGESGCALPAAQQGFSDVSIKGEPQRVKIKISLDGKEIGAADLTPNYMTSQPNGEGCEPTCKSASGEVPLP